jgi:hypothetical protein
MCAHRIPISLSSILTILLLPSQTLAAVASTITITASTAPTPTSTSYTSDADFENTTLAAHNFYRAEHNASALTWNTTSATYAAKWAGNCNFVHSVSRTPFAVLFGAQCSPAGADVDMPRAGQTARISPLAIPMRRTP